MIWLVRHGQTQMNVEGRFNGRVDLPLTAHGEDQARRRGARLRELAAEVRGDWVLAPSTAGRARHTAALIADVSGLPVCEPDARLVEYDFGAWETLTRDEILALRPDLAGVERFFLRNEDGESEAQLTARVRAWMDDAAASPQHRVAVSHAGTGRMMRGLYLGLTLDETRELETSQEAIYRFIDGRIDRYDCAPLSPEPAGA